MTKNLKKNQFLGTTVIKIKLNDNNSFFFMRYRKITILLVGLDNAGKTCTVKSIMRGKIMLQIYFTTFLI